MLLQRRFLNRQDPSHVIGDQLPLPDGIFGVCFCWFGFLKFIPVCAHIYTKTIKYTAMIETVISSMVNTEVTTEGGNAPVTQVLLISKLSEGVCSHHLNAFYCISETELLLV